MAPLDLTPNNAFIFRITHRDNLAWILDHGLHARNGQLSDPNFRRIGDRDVIEKRRVRAVSVGNGGTLSDYIPFYFTPYSMMAYNINTGYRGIEQIPNDDILVFASSLHAVSHLNIPFVFTDQHALRTVAQYFTDLNRLDTIKWAILRNRDFKHDPDDPAKTDLYQAEALIWKHIPINPLLEIGCHSEGVREEVQHQLTQRGLNVKATCRKDWYFA